MILASPGHIFPVVNVSQPMLQATGDAAGAQ
jgi:hypothetical protein